MLTVPTQPLPYQTFQVTLGGQACTISLQQYAYGLFLTLSVGGVAIISNVICENLNRLVRDAYLGFVGDLAFLDTQGLGADPAYIGLGSRWVLLYFAPADLPGGEG